MKQMLLIVGLLVLTVGTVCSAAEELTYIELINRLTDLERLAVLPVPGETCAQWSSYDRASRYDEKTGKYIGWDINSDWAGMISSENGKSVMARIEGPGCIWRIWSATAKNGHVKIYLDGSDEPAVDLPFSGYFDGLHAPFIYPSLVHIVTNGKNNYVPIPFQKSCEIVADEDWGAYYHFTYSTFPKGTKAPTFKRNLSDEELAALSQTDRFLSFHLGSDPAGVREGEVTEYKKFNIAPGKTATIADIKGKRAITAIRVKINPKSLIDVNRALRETVLQIKWDGEKSPSVWTPLGDFFGTAPGINYHRSLPLGMSEDGECYSLWYMPFASRALIQITNDGKTPFPLDVSITHAPLTRPIEQLGRFHAKWHLDAFLPEEPERAIDWTMLTTRGRGRFCGVMLQVWNPKGGWWGEGDEKFFVDGEKFPSTFGTGSEDYFGYAWSDPELFQNAYHNQTISEGNAGNVSVNRFHIADNVPFQKSFEGAIEKYWENSKPTQYACISYWYLAPGGVDPYKPVTPAGKRTDYRLEAVYYIEQGAIEGEELKVTGITAGDYGKQMIHDNKNHKWSRGHQLRWHGEKPGAKMTIALPVEQDGRYDILAGLTKSVDYAIVKLYLDDTLLAGPIDLYSRYDQHTGKLLLSTRELTAGEHELTIEIIGANEDAYKNYVFGLDYIKLEPAPAVPDLTSKITPDGAIRLDSLDFERAIYQGFGEAAAGLSANGKPISLGGVTYPHGIGTHAASDMRIKLNGSATQFVSMVGVDDGAAKEGSVSFEVWVDGRKAIDTGIIKAGDEPKLLSVDLTGADELELRVRDGGDGIGSDHADWAGAMIFLDSDTKERPEVVEHTLLKPARMAAHPVSAKLEIHGPRIVGTTPGNDFLFLIPATGEGPLTFSARGLPDGLTLDPNTGIITGSLQKGGEYVVELTAKCPEGVGMRDLTIVGGKHKLALTPPMGWNSWNCWAGSIDDEKVRQAADWMVKSGLAAHGYQYINIDDCWEAERDENGEIQSNEKFPDMKALADYVHSKGLKLGIYSSPGPKTCAGYEGSWQHEAQDAKTYAKWGIDYLKHDWCSYGSIAIDKSLEELQKPYIVMRNALDECGRDIVYSLCQYGMGDVWKWGAEVGGNCWRTTGDIWDSWGSMSSIGFNQNGLEKYASPGHWNDPDMLVVGMVGWGSDLHPSRLTPNEQVTHITLWSLISSPLLLGCDLARLDQFTIDLLTNDEVIDVNQDPLGKPAGRVSQDGELEIWARPLYDGTMAAGLFNRSLNEAKVTVKWSDLGLSGKQHVRDLWMHQDLGVFEDSFSIEVPAHGAVLLKIGKGS